MAENHGLTGNQKKAIDALLGHNTVRAAAAAAGLAERTVHRYMTDPVFATELRRREGLLIDEGTRRLLREFEASIDTMATVRDDPEVTPAARLRAAQVIAEQLVKVRELRNVEERLTKLEAAINANN